MRLDTTIRVHQILLYITVIVVNYFNPFNRGVIFKGVILGVGGGCI